MKSAFDASPLVMSTGGLFYGRVFDREVPPPYVTYSLVTGVSDNDMTGKVDQIVVQFSVWSVKRSPGEVMTLARQLWNVYDDAQLVTDDYSVIRIDRVSYNLISDPDTEGWQMQTDYRITIQEQ